MFCAVCAGVCEPVLVEIDCRYVDRPAASNGSVLVVAVVDDAAVVPVVAAAVVAVDAALVVATVLLLSPTAEPSTEPNDNGSTVDVALLAVLLSPTAEPSTEPNDNGSTVDVESLLLMPSIEFTAAANCAPEGSTAAVAVVAVVAVVVAALGDAADDELCDVSAESASLLVYAAVRIELLRSRLDSMPPKA